MSNEIPVFMTRVECPVCKTVNDFETIKVGAYTEHGRDTDFCPTERVWRNSKYQPINPLLYFMATCSSCYYTREFNKSFKEWKSDPAFRSYRQKAVREKHLNALAGPGAPFKLLGMAMDLQEAPNETAVVKLLLGIMDEKLLERPSYLDLGRWYLRIAWLFRELGGEAELAPSSEEVQRRRLHAMLRSLRETCGTCEQQIEEIRKLVEQQPAVGPSTEDPCRSAVTSWRTYLHPILASVDDLLTWRSEGVAPSSLPDEAARSSYSFGGYPSFEGFLNAVAERDPEVPRDEQQTISWSLLYYRRAYEETRDVSSGNQKIQVAYLIGELARRAGEIEEAWQYFNVAIRTGQEFIHEHRQDPAKTALAQRIMELARDQARACRGVAV